MLLKEVLSGILIGVLSGFFGLGGSSVATPILKSFAGVNPIFALATPLLTVIPSSLSASVIYYRKNLINFDVAKLTILSGLPFVIIGAYLTKFVSGEFLMLATAVFVLFVGLSFLKRENLFGRGGKNDKNLRLKLISLSPLIGLVSGFLANGGGVMLVPMYVKILKMDIKNAFGTSFFVISFFAVPGAVTHFMLGHIDLKLFLILAFAAIPFASLSAKIAIKLKSERLEFAYGVFLVVFAIYFFIGEFQILL